MKTIKEMRQRIKDKYYALIMKKTRKEMREEIKDKYYSIPEMQVSPGIYIKTIGHKYVTLIDTWGETTLEKIPIKEFYEEFNRD